MRRPLKKNPFLSLRESKVVNRFASQSARRDRAFTLMEMLLVIVIIGILVGGVAVSLSGRSQEAMVTRARADVSGHLALALDMFEADMGRFPADDEGLEVLVNNPGEDTWKGPYLRGRLLPDPWGTPYEYSLDPQNPRRYLLSSAGPDQQVGTEDDVEG